MQSETPTSGITQTVTTGTKATAATATATAVPTSPTVVVGCATSTSVTASLVPAVVGNQSYCTSNTKLDGQDGDNNGSEVAKENERKTQCEERPHWHRIVNRGLREAFVRGIYHEMKRAAGGEDSRHLRMCASRYESKVWKRSANEMQYVLQLRRKLQSLGTQPSKCQFSPTMQAENTDHPSQCQQLDGGEMTVLSACHCRHHRPSNRRSSSIKRSGKQKRQRQSSPSALSSVIRDELYFNRLRVMKIKYRDEVALVYRELCRVNTVIQQSASLRRHESNNLGDFLANLKKIIYLLEQLPDEMSGMIPARKRTIEYLDVVESHIQRKVLPILCRLRHTYSTILRPIVLNYLKNYSRFPRRL